MRQDRVCSSCKQQRLSPHPSESPHTFRQGYLFLRLDKESLQCTCHIENSETLTYDALRYGMSTLHLSVPHSSVALSVSISPTMEKVTLLKCDVTFKERMKWNREGLHRG